MLNPFQDYFSYTKSKVSGIIGLVVIVLLFFFAPYVYFNVLSIDSSDSITTNQVETVEPSANTFDPNVADKATLTKYGLSDVAVENILRFRARGGKFYSAESLQKVYGISVADYERIAPFVKIK